MTLCSDLMYLIVPRTMGDVTKKKTSFSFSLNFPTTTPFFSQREQICCGTSKFCIVQRNDKEQLFAKQQQETLCNILKEMNVNYFNINVYELI